MEKGAKKKHRKKTILIIAGSLLLALIIFRLFLPSIVLRYVNKQLTLIDGYAGHVDDIDIALIRGAYTIHDIKLDKTGGKVPVPFFAAKTIDISVQWNALFHGAIVGEIEVDNATLNFVNGPSKATSQTKIDKDWTEVVDNLIPLKLNRFEVSNSSVHFRDFHSDPTIDLKATNLHILAENLSNAKQEKNDLPSNVTATAKVYDGQAKLTMKLNPLNKVPTFDANAELTALNLVSLNDFLRAYGNFDVEKGSISIYTEAAAKEGQLSGYAKPIVKDLKVVNWKEDKDQPLKLIWESVVEGVGWLFKNKKKDQLATRASFEGNIDKPDVNIWDIIGEVLYNAFIQALYPSLENSVNLNKVGDKGKEEKKTFLQKIFGKSKDK